MAHYSIFIPGATGTSKCLLESVKLGDLQRKHGWSWYTVASGPDGGPGAIGTVLGGEESPLMDYKPDLQKWVPVGNRPDLELEKGAFWFGYEPERPPTPTDLMHKRVIQGKSVILGDGNAWQIPETLQLPLDVGRDKETGELTKLYSEDYEKFCKMAERYVFVFFENIVNLERLRELRPDVAPEETSVEFSMEDSWSYCAQALSINYRVAEPLIGPDMLHLFDDRRMGYIIVASLAFPDILEVIEKKKITQPVSIPVGWNMSLGEETPADPQLGSTSTS